MANKSETNAMGVNEAAVPYPGSHQIPQWKLGELPEAPLFTWRNWVAMIGPGFLMGALAIGGGEWLMGPIITAKFGAGLLWLALLALLCQLIQIRCFQHRMPITPQTIAPLLIRCNQ